MSPIELGSPHPRAQPVLYEEHQYQFVSRQYLSGVPSRPILGSFVEIVERRRTKREFGELSDDALSTLLLHSLKTANVSRDVDGYLSQHRPSPSAGGRHPIDVFIFNRANSRELSLYDPLSHSIGALPFASDDLEMLDAQLNLVVPSKGVTALWFGAQFGKTNSKYENADSLVWRDAGCLLATIGLVAEALELNFCSIGITGEPWLSRALRCGTKVMGVGGCLVGGRRTS